jgi:glycerol kinase
LENLGLKKLIKLKTGLILDTYFSASKIQWLLENVPKKKSKLLIGTIDTWLVWKLTNGKVHITDYSNACRTMLYNIHELQWDQELVNLFGIKGEMLPKVVSSNLVVGCTTADFFSKDIPIASIIGDSSASLFGQCCFTKGTAKATYGTGSSIMLNIGSQPKQSEKGIVTSIAWGIDNTITYVFEGNIHSTGDTIKWLIENLGLLEDEKTSEELANSLNDNEGVYLVPALLGLGAPYWDNEAKACFIGMTRNTRKAHLVRAALESIAYQIKDLIEVMVNESGDKLRDIKVDGGPTKNTFLMQFQANMLDVPVIRNEIEEVSALGAFFMAALAVGFYKNTEEINLLKTNNDVFIKNLDNERKRIYYLGWKEALHRALCKK